MDGRASARRTEDVMQLLRTSERAVAEEIMSGPRVGNGLTSFRAQSECTRTGRGEMKMRSSKVGRNRFRRCLRRCREMRARVPNSRKIPHCTARPNGTAHVHSRTAADSFHFHTDFSSSFYFFLLFARSVFGECARLSLSVPRSAAASAPLQPLSF